MKWEEKRLDELGLVKRGKSKHRPRDAAHLYGGPYPFVQTGDIKHSNLYLTSFEQTYSEAGLAQSKLWPKGTLCITIAANIADTAILGIDACFPDSVIGFIANEEACDTRFIKYKFDTVKKQYLQVSQGAAQDNLSATKLLSFKLKVPCVEIQREIASILSAYDDLMENNLRRIALLEESARLLNKEWFVRLRFPGYEHTRIINGVPEGWEKANLKNLVETQYGYTETATDEIVGPKFLRGTDINKTPFIDWSTVPYCPIDEGLKFKYKLHVNDIVIIRMADPGKVAIVEREIDAVFASYLIRIRWTDLRLRPYFLFYTLSSDQYQASISGVSTGSTRKTANARLLVDFNFVLPTKIMVNCFEDAVRPLRRQITTLLVQNEKLRQARNFLLPKLMSGEIEV